MNDRLTTLALALAAFVVVVFLFSPNDPEDEKEISLPTTEDPGADGLKGLFTWLQREKMPVVSYRKRFSNLVSDKSLAQTGNVLIANIPTSTEIWESEWDDLADWLERGNTIVILGAIYHRPAWASGEDSFYDVKSFLARYDWTLTAKDNSDDEGKPSQNNKANNTSPSAKPNKKDNTFRDSVSALEASIKGFIPQQSQLTATPISPLMDKVKTISVHITPNLGDEIWTLTNESSDSLALRLLSLADTKDTAAWLMNADSGRIVLLLTPDLFSNTVLGQDDNAQFFKNLISLHLAPKGKLLFDDYHFGLSELYDPDRFFSDTRLHKTLGCLFLFWLFYVIGHTNRLAPVRMPVTKLTSGDFIDVMAGFFARRTNKPTLAEALVKHLLSDLAKKRRLPNETEAWHWLEHHNRVNSSQLNMLKKAQARQHVSLLNLTNTIAEIRTITL